MNNQNNFYTNGMGGYQNGTQGYQNQPGIMQNYNLDIYGRPIMATPINNQVRTNQILGKFISSPNDILPNEVPMDGSVGIFPSTDGSCILAKHWNSDGTITTIRFIPEVVVSNEQKPDLMSEITDRLDRIEKMLSSRQKQSNSQPKKED